jgi:hypothetical protein
MLMLGDTLMLHPAEQDSHPRRTAVAAALAFALSPVSAAVESYRRQ